MKEILAFMALFFLSVNGGKDPKKVEFEFGVKDVKHGMIFSAKKWHLWPIGIGYTPLFYKQVPL